METTWTPLKASKELGVSARYVRRAIREGKLVADKFNGRLFIDPLKKENRPYIEGRQSRMDAEKLAA